MPATSAREAAPSRAGGPVELIGISRRFGAVTALSSVDLTIDDGGFYSLLGPSGCGKTTLLRILAGFDQPDEGDVRIDGRSVLGVPPHRRPTNIVFQRYALFPHLSVYDNVAFGLTTGGRRRRKAALAGTRRAVQEMLDLVGLPDYGQRLPRQLSGGQAQRVALARALIRRPRLLLLDEPLSALDQNVRLSMRESLLNIHRESGTTFLLVTHDQEEALSMSTCVALMNAGGVEQVGTPTTLYREPATPFAARFLGSGSMVPVTIEQVEATAVTVAGGGASWHPASVGVTAPGPGLVFLRPEELRLTGPDDGRIAGTVVTTVFLGSVHEVIVASALGNMRLRTAVAPAVGERVHLAWTVGAGRCYPSEPAR